MIPPPACPAEKRGENLNGRIDPLFSRLAYGEPRQGVG